MTPQWGGPGFDLGASDCRTGGFGTLTTAYNNNGNGCNNGHFVQGLCGGNKVIKENFLETPVPEYVRRAREYQLNSRTMVLKHALDRGQRQLLPLLQNVLNYCPTSQSPSNEINGENGWCDVMNCGKNLCTCYNKCHDPSFKYHKNACTSFELYAANLKKNVLPGRWWKWNFPQNRFSTDFKNIMKIMQAKKTNKNGQISCTPGLATRKKTNLEAIGLY